MQQKNTKKRVFYSVIAAAIGLWAAQAQAKQWQDVSETSQFYAQIGSSFRLVATVDAGEDLIVRQASSEAQDIQFGNGVAVLKSGKLGASERHEAPTLAANSGFVVLNEPAALYDSLESEKSAITLAGNLRYPFIEAVKGGYKVLFANQIKYLRAEDVEPDNGIPILTYHHVLRDDENKAFRNTSTTTSDVAFAHQISEMKHLGFDALSLYQLEDYLKGRANLPAKSLVLTFDDGLKSVLRYAYPVLKAQNYKATMFTITSRIRPEPETWAPDSLQFLSVSEMKSMSDVFDWQSHTYKLHELNRGKGILLQTQQRPARLDFERSKRQLAEFNSNVRYLSYPFGHYNDSSIAAAKEAGIVMAVTTKVGKVKFGDDPYQLKRIYFLKEDSDEKIAEMLSNQPPKHAEADNLTLPSE